MEGEIEWWLGKCQDDRRVEWGQSGSSKSQAGRMEDVGLAWMRALESKAYSRKGSRESDKSTGFLDDS